MLGKSQDCLRTQSSAQFHLQKWVFGTSAQKLHKRGYQSLLFLSDLIWFNFSKNILHMNVATFGNLH